jgi:hypothetical protein
MFNTCAIEGCNDLRAPKPSNPKYKQSKYCPAHKREAKQSFLQNIGFDKTAARERDEKFAAAWEKAEAAGLAAGQQVQVVPMIVNQHESVLDDASPVTESYFVAAGSCGFASVYIKPANSAFANWVKRNKLKGDNGSRYYGGMTIRHVFEFNQSHTRKTAFAHAFAKVLRDELGVPAYTDNRED